jgi:hypothetical protein
MSPPRTSISSRELATIYNISENHVRLFARNHGVPRTVFLDPDAVFDLTLKGSKSPLRARLLDPARRQRTKELLAIAAEARATAAEALAQAKL